MQLIQAFQQFVAEKKLFSKNDKLLIAVSGGVDSVVLCELCHCSGYQFAIAHCNFKLRGAESDEDENWVKKLASTYNVKWFNKQFDTEKFAQHQHIGIQEAARMLRYKWFEELITVDGTRAFDYLLTAHHAADNVETLLMNFFKGTGIAGLTGIKPKDSGMGSHLIRPLLFAAKNEILQFAAEQKLSWREDASNASNKYTRNFFRNDLLPSLAKLFPKVDEHLLNNIARFEEIQVLYKHSVKQFAKKLLIETEDGFQIPILGLLKTPAYTTVLFELLKPYSFTAVQTNEVLKLCHASNGKYVSSSTHRIIRNRKWLLITKLNTNNNSLFVLDNKDMKLTAGEFTLSIQAFEGEAAISSQKDVVSVDSSEVAFPLLLRKWKQGDYFYPLGMTKKKKISRFLIDEKLSLPEKEKVWVIESAGRIVWVVGRRIDNRFKIKPSTTSFLRLSISE